MVQLHQKIKNNIPGWKIPNLHAWHVSIIISTIPVEKQRSFEDKTRMTPLMIIIHKSTNNCSVRIIHEQFFGKIAIQLCYQSVTIMLIHNQESEKAGYFNFQNGCVCINRWLNLTP